ncbi:hypothetical protein DFA_00009 [Cavenderia fasciculata]|uniref:Uncharacterized protein n=1 Tax=Cavenderia fasciculata TaxID=261658 RepID=F4PXC2_CACFS|nr:uncharacterized protein DFA_00009 [Cavenderia fasciculata]EGG19432.1 hypothetical protein DFA_00009 [Cavenderia fasciculata]|eukprot:XP_004357726.1 hypothetical protein DFA_00009 [Cavenderia fasciculata]
MTNNNNNNNNNNNTLLKKRDVSEDDEDGGDQVDTNIEKKKRKSNEGTLGPTKTTTTTAATTTTTTKKPFFNPFEGDDEEDDLFPPMNYDGGGSSSSSSSFTSVSSSTIPLFVGFQTGNKQKINISEDKLRAASESFKSLENDDDDDDDEAPITTTSSSKKPTTTASSSSLSSTRPTTTTTTTKQPPKSPQFVPPTPKPPSLATTAPIATTTTKTPTKASPSGHLNKASSNFTYFHKGAPSTPTKPTASLKVSSSKSSFVSPVKKEATIQNFNGRIYSPAPASPNNNKYNNNSNNNNNNGTLSVNLKASSITPNKVCTKPNKPVDLRKKLSDLGSPFTKSPIGIVTKEVLAVTRKNCEDYEFDGTSNEAKDLGFVRQKKIAHSQIYIHLSKDSSFKCVTDDWVRNHYGWIVWKLAAMERAFPDIFGGKHLTLYNVMTQLKKRCTKELVQCQRPILKKIYAKDYSSEKHMILCVSDILSNESENRKVQDSSTLSEPSQPTQVVIELTDGWYSIKALLDPFLSQCLSNGKIFVGQKLRIQGAKLEGIEGGAHPLEAEGERAFIKIFANSTRRAKWFDKLGLQPQLWFPISLKSVIPGGGVIQSLNVKILKKYPMEYREIIEGKATIKRPQSEEYKIQNTHQLELEKIQEKLAYEISEKYQKDQDKDLIPISSFEKSNLGKIYDGDLLYRMYKSQNESNSLIERLNEEQQSILRKEIENKQFEMNEKIASEIKQAINGSTRNVTPILKIRITDDPNVQNKQQSENNNNNNGNTQPIKSITTGNSYMTQKQIFDSVDEPELYLPSNNFNPPLLPPVQSFIDTVGKNPVFPPVAPVTFGGASKQQSYGDAKQKVESLSNETILHFYNPSEELISQLNEGEWIHFNHLQPMFSNSMYRNKIAELKNHHKTTISSTSKNTTRRQAEKETKDIPKITHYQTQKIGQECDLIGLLIHVGPNISNVDNIRGNKEVTRTLYIGDSSNCIAKITLCRVAWTKQNQENANKQDNNISNLNMDISIPFAEGFTRDALNIYNHTNVDRYPIIHLANLKYEGYDSNKELYCFGSKDTVDITVTPKSKLADLFHNCRQWLLLSPGSMNLFTQVVKLAHVVENNHHLLNDGDFQFDFDDEPIQQPKPLNQEDSSTDEESFGTQPTTQPTTQPNGIMQYKQSLDDIDFGS